MKWRLQVTSSFLTATALTVSRTFYFFLIEVDTYPGNFGRLHLDGWLLFGVGTVVGSPFDLDLVCSMLLRFCADGSHLVILFK